MPFRKRLTIRREGKRGLTMQRLPLTIQLLSSQLNFPVQGPARRAAELSIWSALFHPTWMGESTKSGKPSAWPHLPVSLAPDNISFRHPTSKSFRSPTRTSTPNRRSATISLDQRQILKNGAEKVEFLLDQLNTRVDENTAETRELLTYLAGVAVNGREQLQKVRAQYRGVPSQRESRANLL